jgi:hypothetical protein
MSRLAPQPGRDPHHLRRDHARASSWATLEGSVFHGAEPDENRWNIEAGPLDSYSGRLTLRPRPGSVQISAGHLEHPGPSRRKSDARHGRRPTKGDAGRLSRSRPPPAATASPTDGRVGSSEWTWKFAGCGFSGAASGADRNIYQLTHAPTARGCAGAADARLQRLIGTRATSSSGRRSRRARRRSDLLRLRLEIDSVYGKTPVVASLRADPLRRAHGRDGPRHVHEGH